MTPPPDRIEVTGPDAVGFLQGQLSQDVAALAVGETAPSFLLEPNGKVSAWLQVARTGESGFRLQVDGGHGQAVIDRLSRFKLRTKVELTALPADGGSAQPAFTEEARIAAGIPRMGAELVPGRTIPAEVGPELLDASVSFTKGCYTGQELVARIDSRGGQVPRRIRGVVFDPPASGSAVDSSSPAVPTGAVIEVDGAPVGEVTSVAWSALRGRVIALASVARAVEPPASAQVRWDGGEAKVTVHALPLDGSPETAPAD